MHLDRRSLLTTGVTAGLGAGLGAGLATGLAASAAAAGPRAGAGGPASNVDSGRAAHGLDPASGRDQTATLQGLIDKAAERRETLLLPPGRFRSGPLVLRAGAHVRGAGAGTVIESIGGGPLISASHGDEIGLADLVFDGDHALMDLGAIAGLVTFADCRNIDVRRVAVHNSTGHGILLTRCSGRVHACRISHVLHAAIHSLDATGLEIASNDVADCGNNGIQVWRSAVGEDGTQVYGNRITRVLALGRGSGENGNGINVFRAGGVCVTSNRITDCAYSAIRGNAASNIQIVSNSCQRLGEVAIYAEFGFEGALIASNLIDGAATGISVTNFDVGGRLAVIQGNLIRNLFRREHEPADKRGEGIAVEADAAITGNTIEGAPTVGIMIGWGRYMRDCVATGNLIRNARVGIMISSDADAGACLIANNMISGATDGAIRAMALGMPHGPDLALTATKTVRVTIAGNVAA